MKLLAIDPGPVESAWLLYDVATGRPWKWAKEKNEHLVYLFDGLALSDEFAIERVASYGMSVGQEVFDTCEWAGRFIQRWIGLHEPLPHQPMRIFRREVKLHLCADSRAKDANIRQALIDRYGGKEKAIGRKASPGPLWGIHGDCWSALAIAVTCAETRLVEAAA